MHRQEAALAAKEFMIKAIIEEILEKKIHDSIYCGSGRQ